MAKENITITSTNGGVIAQKTISNINPAATNAQLATFGGMLNSLTTNTYGKTDRVRKVNCDTEPGGGSKPEPTLTLSRTTATASEINVPGTAVLPIEITTNSTGNLYFRPATIQDNLTKIVYAGFNTIYGTIHCSLGKWGDTLVVPQTVYIGVTETDTYAAKEVAFTITA